MNALDRTIARLCDDIDRLEWENETLRLENEELKKKYHDSVMGSIRHSENMMGNLLKLTLAAGDETVRAAFGND